MAEQDPFAGGKEVSTQQVTFGAISDFIKGTYTAKKIVHANGKDVALYEVKGNIGSFHTVDGKKNPIEPAVVVEKGAYYNIFGGKDSIDSLFAKSKFGEIIAIRLEKETESKTKGNAPFKTFKTLQFGMDPEYFGEDSSVEARVEESGI